LRTRTITAEIYPPSPADVIVMRACLAGLDRPALATQVRAMLDTVHLG
jgi:hypothetical protein